MTTGITTPGNLQQELPLQAMQEFLSTPQFNLIYGFGCQQHMAESFYSNTLRMSRFAPLNTDGGLLDGSGIDPAPEVPVRTDIDAKQEIYAKSLLVNEQVYLYQNERTMTKMMLLLGQWKNNKEDLLMRDLFASSPAYINATGGLNGDQPSNITRSSINNIERILLGQDALTILQSQNATPQFATSGLRDGFLGLIPSEITPDMQAVEGVLMRNAYPGDQSQYRPEEYCSVGAFRFFQSSKGIKVLNASALGATVFRIPMFGMEAVGKILQNGINSKVGFIPAWAVSTVAQNVAFYAKFGMARAIQNQNWLSGLNVTVRY